MVIAGIFLGCWMSTNITRSTDRSFMCLVGRYETSSARVLVHLMLGMLLGLILRFFVGTYLRTGVTIGVGGTLVILHLFNCLASGCNLFLSSSLWKKEKPGSCIMEEREAWFLQV